MFFLQKFKKYDFPLLGLIRLPEIIIDNKYKTDLDLKTTCSNFEFLSFLTKKNLSEKKHLLPQKRLDEYIARADFELKIFEDLGFVDYVLLVWKVINKAREMNAFLDYGRGSMGGSFVFALLGITGVLDVIDKGFFFERFISKTRSKKQIIDGITYLDGSLICDADLNLGGIREEIVQWLRETYEGKVCKISALSTFTGKILIKDTYKCINEVSEDEAKRVADLIDKHFGVVEDIEKMPEKSKEFKKWTEDFPETYRVALSLRNSIRQKSSHASGYFIGFFDLNDFAPLEMNKEKELTLVYEMEDAAKLGVKLDLLGLTTNEILQEVFKSIPEKLEDINLDENPIVYDQFQNNNLLPYGLYQISADCGFKVLNEIKPKNIFELSDVNAIARPGALSYLKDYNERSAKLLHPSFEPILKNTRNLCLYQEQLMQLLIAVGFTPDEAEICRKIVGKKLLKEVGEWKDKIYQKVKENNLDIKISDALWKILNDSANYSFNKVHSHCVALLGALTVYLKYKYPQQFYLACLNGTKNLPNPIEEISIIQPELRHFDIELLAPHILKSDLEFKMEGKNLRFGLAQIKTISDKSIEKLNKFKHEYSNKFEIFEAANEAKIPISILSSLILVGALDDGLGKQTRARVLLEAQLWNLLTGKQEKKLMKEWGPKFQFDLIETLKYVSRNIKNEKGNPVVKESRLVTLRRDFEPYNKMYDYNKRNEAYSKFWFESKLLGFSYSTKLIDIFKDEADDLISIQNVLSALPEEKVHFVGQVVETKEWTSKEKKTKCLKCKVKDETGSIDVLIFNNSIEEHNFENSRQAVAEDVVVIKGKKKQDAVFAWKIGIQTSDVFVRISEMTKIEKAKKENRNTIM